VNAGRSYDGAEASARANANEQVPPRGYREAREGRMERMGDETVRRASHACNLEYPETVAPSPTAACVKITPGKRLW